MYTFTRDTQGRLHYRGLAADPRPSGAHIPMGSTLELIDQSLAKHIWDPIRQEWVCLG